MSDKNFSSVALPKGILKTLEEIGFDEMTPIQAKTLPLILFNRDVIAQAKTGSGKTAAYALGLLPKIDVSVSRVQSLVLTPTRELADQVSKEIRRLGRSIPNLKVITLCGGTNIKPQIASLEHGAHIVVATPGRLDEHLRKGRLRLNFLRTFILDEADRMLELGFKPILDSIFNQATIARQTMLYSATFPHSIESIVDNFMADPVRVEIESEEKPNIEQKFYKVNDDQQRDLVAQLLIKEHKPKSTLIFCTTKIQTQNLADQLKYKGFNALPLHGDLTQAMREQTLTRFSNKSTSVLVATDVAARGIDIEGLDLVMNYQLPLDSEVYVHRIGRTGRAGKSGMAISLFNEKEKSRVKDVGNFTDQEITLSKLPDEKWLDEPSFTAENITIRIGSGKKQKIRAGDIVGTITKNSSITADKIGKIAVYDNVIFIAVDRSVSKESYLTLKETKVKGKTLKVQTLFD